MIARFESERQALAMMEHPNVARVFEAGATESGRPCFVMELVRGSHPASDATGSADVKKLLPDIWKQRQLAQAQRPSTELAPHTADHVTSANADGAVLRC